MSDFFRVFESNYAKLLKVMDTRKERDLNQSFEKPLMTIFNKCSKFQNDLINILGDMTY